MQRAFGGVAPAPLKDKRFFIFFRKGASFFETISLKVNCRGQTSISRTFSVAFRRALCRHTSRTQRFFAAWPRLSWNPSFFNNFCNDVSWRIQSIVMVFHAQHLPLWLRASIGNHYFCDNFVLFDDIFREANYQTNPSILWHFFNDLRRALISPCPDSSDFLMKNCFSGSSRVSTIPTFWWKIKRLGSHRASTVSIFWRFSGPLQSATTQTIPHTRTRLGPATGAALGANCRSKPWMRMRAQGPSAANDPPDAVSPPGLGKPHGKDHAGLGEP